MNEPATPPEGPSPGLAPAAPARDEPSRLQMLIERDLAEKNLGTLAQFVASRRATSSWTAIADELSAAAGRDVSDETLRRWFADRLQIEVRVA